MVLKRIEKAIKRIRGIVDVIPLSHGDLKKILDLEKEAGNNAAMGIIKCSNEGLMEVSQRDMVIAVANNNDFRHASEPTIYWKAGDVIIGKEVPTKCDIEKLKMNKNILFIGQKFVIYKDTLKQARGKEAIFVFPGLTFSELEIVPEIKNIISASPSGLADIYIKEKAHWSLTDPTLGTILIGFNLVDKSDD